MRGRAAALRAAAGAGRCAHRAAVVGAALGAGRRCPRCSRRGWAPSSCPSLDEGDVAVHALRIPGTSLTQVDRDAAHAGTAARGHCPKWSACSAASAPPEVANDPMPPSMTDTFVMMKPRESWPDPRKPKALLVEDLEAVARSVPGNNYEFTQPIQMRMNELISGVRADVAIKVIGDDLEVLERLAASVGAHRAGRLPGAADVTLEETTGLPMLVVTPDREALSRYGLNPRDVQRTVSTAIGGTVAGQFIEGDRRSDIVVRLPDALRQSPEWLADLPIPRRRARKRRRSLARRQLVGRRAALRAAARGGETGGDRAAPTRSTARTASAAWSSPPTCAGAIWAASWTRCASGSTASSRRRPATGSTTAARSSNSCPPRSAWPSWCRWRCVDHLRRCCSSHSVR